MKRILLAFLALSTSTFSSAYAQFSPTREVQINGSTIQPLTDEELDNVKGEVAILAPLVPVAVEAIGGAVVSNLGRAAVGAVIGSVLTSDSAQHKPLTNGDIRDLKDNGYDPHELKQSGSGGRVSDKDLYKDKQGNVYVHPKGGKGPGEPTGVNLRDLR